MVNIAHDAKKRQFGRRLHWILMEKQMSQSDLAYKIWGREIDSPNRKAAKYDKRGRAVDNRKGAAKRDLVSKWVRGIALPSRLNLQKLAKAIEMDTEDLLPGGNKPLVDKSAGTPIFRATSIGPNELALEINQVVTDEQLDEIRAILRGRKE